MAAAGWVRQGLGLLFFFLSSIDAGWASDPGREAVKLRCEGQSHPIITQQPWRAAKKGSCKLPTVPSSVQYGQGPMPVSASGVMDVYLKDLWGPIQVPACPPVLPERVAPDTMLVRRLVYPAPVAEGGGAGRGNVEGDRVDVSWQEPS